MMTSRLGGQRKQDTAGGASKRKRPHGKQGGRAMTDAEVVKLEGLGLTPREAEVLAWVAQGKSNGMIGSILRISPRTVQKHLQRTFPKLGVESRTEAATHALAFMWKNG
jgi:DNA-binding CsgD family transcriptional regulator